MVQSHVRQVQEEFGSNKREVTRDDDGPCSIARGQSRMKTPQRSPLRVNIWNGWEGRSV